MSKLQLEESHYLVDFKAGYKESCGVVAVNTRGELMCDQLGSLDCGKKQQKLSVFFESGDTIELKYDFSSSKLAIKNLTSSNKVVIPYKIRRETIGDYFVGVLIGPGAGSFALKAT